VAISTVNKERKVIARVVGVAISLVVSATALAYDWKFFPSTRILSTVQWDGATNPVYLEVAPSTYCYIKAEEKAMIALAMTLYLSGRKADIHCYAEIEVTGGLSGHRVHRIIAR